VLRSDPNQAAVLQVLDKWGQDFISKETRLLEFKDEMNKLVDLGQNAKTVERNKGVRIAEQYNTFMDPNYGKRAVDPYAI
jgi:hypothetical protein